MNLFLFQPVIIQIIKVFKRIMTNISTDRILSTGGYSPENLIFTTWKYNNAKNNITPNMAQAFLKIVKERYGTEDIEWEKNF